MLRLRAPSFASNAKRSRSSEVGHFDERRQDTYEKGVGKALFGAYHSCLQELANHLSLLYVAPKKLGFFTCSSTMAKFITA
jgi:hypothetical protein